MRYLFYRIETKEPVKMSGQSKAEEIEGSLDYITGSSVRGAVIGVALRNLSQENKMTGEIKQRLLKQIYFFNAYPIYEVQSDSCKEKERRAFPAPYCFYGKKSDLTAYNGKRIEVRSIWNTHENPVSWEEKVCMKEPFVCFRGDTVYGIKVKKDFQLHTSVNISPNHGMEKAMFRYEAIQPNQDFCGIIMTEDTDLADMMKGFLEDKEYYLGGSKGSGYGKVSIHFLYEGEKEAASEYVWKDDQKVFYVYYLSDAILYDSYGKLVSYLPEDFLKQHLEVENIEYMGGPGRTVNITGYNSAWHYALPQLTGIKAGTVQKYRYKGNNQSLKEKIEKLQEKGVGIRRQDGYGRILILPEGFEQRYWERYGSYRKKTQEKDGDTFQEISKNKAEEEKIMPEIQEQAKMVLKPLYSQKVMRGIDKYIVRIGGMINNRSISNAQIGRLLELFSQAEYSDGKSMKQKVNKYFADMEGRKRNSGTNESLMDTKIGEHSLKEVIKDFVNASEDVDAFIKRREFRIYRLSEDIFYKPDEQEVFRYNMIFIKKFLKYLLR